MLVLSLRRGAIGVAAALAATGLSVPQSAAFQSVRPVIVFAPSEMDARLLQQIALFEGDATATSERDIALVYVLPDAVTENGLVVDVSAADMRAWHRIDAGAFAVLLVGKDRGVKARYDEVVSPSEIFGLIDQMPMRRREMRERSDP